MCGSIQHIYAPQLHLFFFSLIQSRFALVTLLICWALFSERNLDVLKRNLKLIRKIISRYWGDFTRTLHWSADKIVEWVEPQARAGGGGLGGLSNLSRARGADTEKLMRAQKLYPFIVIITRFNNPRWQRSTRPVARRGFSSAPARFPTFLDFKTRPSNVVASVNLTIRFSLIAN